MKQTPNEDRIARRMSPGTLTREGFLGDDHRQLPEILEHDDQEVGRLGLTHPQIAQALREAMQVAMSTYGTPTRAGNLTAVYHEAMGRIPCPWGHGTVTPKGEIELTDPQTLQTLRYTPLSVHLIEEHGFYQGRGSRYRLEPAEVARLLDLAPQEEPS